MLLFYKEQWAGKQNVFQEKWAALLNLSFSDSQLCLPLADLSTALLLTLQISSVL